MRPPSLCLAVALLALPTLGFGYSGPGRVKSGPAIVPYLCHDGREATVIYENGSDYQHAKALVTYDGQTRELVAAPTLYGVRYRTAEAQSGGPALAWSLRGEEAWLTESPDADGYTRRERELARCVRLRGAMPEGAHSDGGEHGGDHGEAH